ncbi:hypothetical protein [Flavihumibacter sp. CACIAM 22H1]|uniref:hypothetical protein n=1 Tax=Flavihumibacter sp. CACIAM 22H1 TaxID=1812911 RepID=UPI0007A88C84|nr:hypothetical protein [Flavihumibacter sp. CACIAM 22H1]KYP13503.1 MAG: hypothetical protein A1D16_12820 [Flavihumibacter sp. CACIAM 22H1]
MKQVMKQWKSLISFDFPLQAAYISAQFHSVHDTYQSKFPFWSLEATKKKVIAWYWFRLVLYHFLTIVGVSFLTVAPFAQDRSGLIPSLFLAGAISLLTLIAFNYWPSYYATFLPNLETAINEHQIRIRQEEELKKCKRSQYSIPTLVVIAQVISQMNECGTMPSNEQTANILNKLYGVDKDKIKQNLARHLKISGITDKERFEILKGVDHARDFFEHFGWTKATPVLNDLENKLQRQKER